ncbi:hypothetical protein [Wenxinia marina]|uniref:Glycosyltransferase involved in LPS biosynthesis n=1 Tax=Wenxinia marina DSM 24838 TaxID=1123501 RepID=A0A0D0QGN8_9RHOB|nr:hypothetical protein [Wenxinia marina]KIQ71432.1 hypothetical protein Wenmar_04080 [Wenxinia marina DSM 24838]GGL78956.1 hypothetical protein GCM10011392_36820 [Wenxinia marina]
MAQNLIADLGVFINLDERPDRRAHIERLLAPAPWRMVRLSATRLSGKLSDHDLTVEPGTSAALAVCSIWQSHRRALQTFLDAGSDGPFALIEDDLQLQPFFWTDGLEYLQRTQLPEDADMVLLNPRYRERKPTDPTVGKRFVAPPLGRGLTRLSEVLETHHCTGAHFCIFPDRAAVARVAALMDAKEMLLDVDVFYVRDTVCYGLAMKSVSAGKFGSDHI